MKKVNYLFVCFCITLFCACQTENSIIDLSENENPNKNVENVLKLRGDIMELNKSTFGATMTRKSIFGGFFKRVLNVVVADVGGFIKGALNGNNVWSSAGSASTKAAVKTVIDITREIVEAKQTGFDTVFKTKKKQQWQEPYNMTDFITDYEESLEDIVPDPVDYADIHMDSIGYYHNKVITELFEENSNIDYWANLSTEEIIEKVDSAFSKEPIYEVVSTEVLASDISTMSSFYDQVSESLDQYESAVELCDDIRDSNPELSDLLMVVSAYIEGLENVNAGEDWNNYTNMVLNLINNSDIELTMKQNLRSAIIVALASSHLWNTETLNL